MRTWLLHWATALLVTPMLFASLPISYPEFLRISPSLWMGVHMTAGWALVAVTAVRLLLLALPHPGDGVRILRPRGSRALTKIALLMFLAAILATGTIIYRPSPLGPRIYLFGLFEAGALVIFDHSMHLQTIIAHRYLAYAFAIVLIIHTYFAFESPARRGPAPIAWLWKRVGFKR